MSSYGHEQSIIEQRNVVKPTSCSITEVDHRRHDNQALGGYVCIPTIALIPCLLCAIQKLHHSTDIMARILDLEKGESRMGERAEYSDLYYTNMVLS